MENWARSAEIAYDAIAPFYDEFTAHHDYSLWVANLLAALERHGLRSTGTLLDVGCGTGKSALPMLDRGWNVCGFDASPRMIEIARCRLGSDVELSVADMRDMPHFGNFDLIWALADAVNYLLSVEELEAALGGMRRNLASGGLVLFDMNTLLAYRTFFAEEIQMQSGGQTMTWRGRGSGDVQPGSIVEATFEGCSEDGYSVTRAAPVSSVHIERHFARVEVEAALERCGFDCLDVFGNTQDGQLEQPLNEAILGKAVYVAR